ncbi:A/G-specific adenine glycosylase [Sphingobacterium spiritivorum]|uniref:A/G-specific adenine glycosylase n=1 Tax=Sphingobacterium spiritivorum TaxID=258 RepID=UPI003DA43BF8
MSFSKRLIAWYDQHGRDLPWRHTQDPYIIWLSEIILQQTRVEQGMPYFMRFSEQYPTVQDFASADEDHILNLWQGLGYYSRGRNMHKAARMVVSDFAGIFPTAYDEVIKLPGVGEYTAAAISSISVNQAKAVLDGNVFRVLSRYFGVEVEINTPAGKKIFTELANEMLDADDPARYNQAIMDFGAMQCKPKSPACGICIFNQECVALKEDKVHLLPLKKKGKGSRNRYFHYFIIEEDDQIMMSRRGEGDVWQNLYEFPMIETTEPLSGLDILKDERIKEYFSEDLSLELKGNVIKHILSHQNIYAQFYKVNNPSALKLKKKSWNYVFLKDLNKLAQHKLIFSFIETNIS